MSEQAEESSPAPVDAGRPADAPPSRAEDWSDLEAALRRLIDVDGRALAVARRAEQLLDDDRMPPAVRQQLIDGMNRMVDASLQAHRFVESLDPPGAAPAAPEAAGRRRPKNPRVRL